MNAEQPKPREFRPDVLDRLDRDLHDRLGRGERFVRIGDVLGVLYAEPAAAAAPATTATTP